MSSWTLEESDGLRKLEEAKIFFVLIKNKLVKVWYASEEQQEARERSNTFQEDASHIVIAEREAADYIVTRNVHDFLAVGTYVPIILTPWLR